MLEAANIPSAATPGYYWLEECTDPDGTTANLPAAYDNREASTLTQSGSPQTRTGAFTTTFTVYDLPDPGSLGQPTMTESCDVDPSQCVIGIFVANPNYGHSGLAYPHPFSAPFQVTRGDGLDQGDNPGDGTPEAAYALALPGLALGLTGSAVWRRRRRAARV